MTPLALAILHGNLDMAKRLYVAGASPLPSRNNGESLLCFAAANQHAPIIRWFVTLGYPNLLNTRDPAGSTPLHHAVLRNSLAVTRALLDAGADPNVHALRIPAPGTPDTDTSTPPPGVGTPLFYTLDKSLNPAQPLDTRLAQLRLLLEYGAYVDIRQEVDGTYPLHEAVMSGEQDIIAALLDEGILAPTPYPDPSKTEQSKNPNNNPLPPRTKSEPNPTRGTLDINIPSSPSDPPMRGTTPLMYAAAACRPPLVRYLLARGADPARVNTLGETALHWAGVNEKEAVPAPSSSTSTPTSDPEKCDQNHQSQQEKKEQQQQQQKEEEEGADAVIRLLVRDAGIDVNARNALGGTALHGAAYRGRLANVRALLELGADRGCVTEGLHYDKLLDGVRGTAEELARGQGHWDVAELIRGWKGEGSG